MFSIYLIPNTDTEMEVIKAKVTGLNKGVMSLLPDESRLLSESNLTTIYSLNYTVLNHTATNIKMQLSFWDPAIISTR